MPVPDLSVSLPDEAATAALGGALGKALMGLEASILQSGLVIYLRGELGAGKTTLVRGLLRYAGVGGAVKSPTYTLLEPYVVSRLNLYHFDFYRFKSPREFADAGFAEYFVPGGACLVEWPEQAGAYVPPADLEMDLQVGESGRNVVVSANSELGIACRDRLQTVFDTSNAGA